MQREEEEDDDDDDEEEEEEEERLTMVAENDMVGGLACTWFQNSASIFLKMIAQYSRTSLNSSGTFTS